MTRYLLAAEADKIQDLLFRSSRLREVVGGSQLLERFCREVARDLLRDLRKPEKDAVVSRGGCFRVLFDSPEAAVDFGERLAEVYRLATGGSLTVAPPVEVGDPVDQHFGESSERAQALLRRAKYGWRDHGRGPDPLEPSGPWESPEQFPYAAFCSSCGVGLAVDYRGYFHDESPTYLCRSCLTKAEAARSGEAAEFLKAFYWEVTKGGRTEDWTWPGKGGREPLEEVAALDPRRYVAYLVADGNSMGELFGRCTSPGQVATLSESLEKVIRRSLAEPTRLLMQRNPADEPRNFIPVLPLILGGDDVFVLLPAPWALDFARRFCQAYECGMRHVLSGMGLDGGSPPTVSAAVVIAKSTHPYYRAHQAGENKLKEAKRLAKGILLGKRPAVSTISFEVVLGGGVEQNRSHLGSRIRPTLQPYLAADGVSEAWGLSLDLLLEVRWLLRSVPNKRLAELERLYDVDEIPEPFADHEMKCWTERLTRVLERIRRFDRGLGGQVEEVLRKLGSPEPPYWRTVERPGEKTWGGHGLPDLLATWDFSLKMDKPRQEYEVGVE